MEAAASSNVSYLPSAKDLLLAVPRLAQRAGTFAFYQVPDALDNVAGRIFSGGSVIADATQQIANSSISNTSAGFAQSTQAVQLGMAMEETWSQGSAGVTVSTSIWETVSEGMSRLKSFGGIFSYLTSKWALATFVAAFVLNRTQFYASSRQHLRLRWHARLALYLIPISAFLSQTLYVLQSMKCQTSPNYGQLRYGVPDAHVPIDFGAEGGFLYWLSSNLLFWQDDATCCAAQHMSLSSVDDNVKHLRGSMSLLFWFFATLCMSQLFETLASALQGRQPLPETGMTIFEHSLAFAECEALVTSALGMGSFGHTKGSNERSANDSGGDLIARMTRGEVMRLLNAPPEVLLVCLISCFSHLSSALLAISGKRHKVRLVNTAIWSCCYMAAFLWSFARFAVGNDGDAADLSILRFPTVCIVGFIPHLLIILGILVCGLVYGVAFVITALSVPHGALTAPSLRQRFAWASQNLQANIHLTSASSIRVKMSEDFYTTLLKIGFNVLTAASEAVYLNEGSRIQVAEMTWLERKRIDQRLLDIDTRLAQTVPSELLGDGIAKGVDFQDHQNAAISRSPYARERKSKANSTSRERAHGGELDSGLGMTQRRSRMHLTFEFLARIFWLLLALQANVVLALLSRMGLERRPTWLAKLTHERQNFRRPSLSTNLSPSSGDQYLWMMGEDKLMSIPKDENVDIEAETRQRLKAHGDVNEDRLSATLYSWWKEGGWFGTLDESGDYEATSEDDDATSVISMSTEASELAAWSDSEHPGQRTPTQRDPFGLDTRDSTPAPDDTQMDLSLLSKLLDPQSSTEREEARLLSRSLQSPGPLTRSRYRRDLNRHSARLLTGLRSTTSKPLSDEDEEQDLEHFILSQRSKPHKAAAGGGTWETGAEGMGAGGPQCVVCQSSPRSILVWPCGCLSMCDECRVGLAARNYTKCICCRTDIAAYSRLKNPNQWLGGRRGVHKVQICKTSAIRESLSVTGNHDVGLGAVDEPGLLPIARVHHTFPSQQSSSLRVYQLALAHHTPTGKLLARSNPTLVPSISHFMQPAASTLLDNDFATTNTTTTQSQLIQHGPPSSASLSPSGVTEQSAATGGDRPALEAHALAPSPPGIASESTVHARGGLKERSTPSPPPIKNRVAEYEQASTPPIRRRAGPGFEVIKKPRNPSDKRSPLQELPNEVLIHALAQLPPSDLASVALVSKRFHALVIGPHAWRSAFAHYFPGPESIDANFKDPEDFDEDELRPVRTDRRLFTRLTALASWRSEYILRTRLLRSLARGKPAQVGAAPSNTRSGQSHVATPVIMYNTHLFTTINHLHATFGSGLNKRTPRFIHGADDAGMATSSDPAAAKVDSWGLSDPQQFFQFADRFPGDAQYGLGTGEVVGVPNVMDVSQPYGMIYGEGFPSGMVYFRSTEEMRGRFLLASSVESALELGIPRIPASREAITAVWIAKSAAIPSLTDGLVGMIAGSSLGVVTTYSLGATSTGNSREQRFARGEMTARWVLSPGVPIVALAVDHDYSLKRQAENRIWAMALNALGEVFYLTKFPTRASLDRNVKLDEGAIERIAWLTGRSVFWRDVEPSRRLARFDPYSTAESDGSYSPRTSWNGMCLTDAQLLAETREIEDFLGCKPNHFQKTCHGWDMQRRLIVDFAGDDGSHAGESAVVIDCGLSEDRAASIKRYMRCRFLDRTLLSGMSTPPLTNGSTGASNSPSLFGLDSSISLPNANDISHERLSQPFAQDDFSGNITPRPITEEWRVSDYSFRDLRGVQVLATALDESNFATRTVSEDPLFNFSAQSATSSPTMSPMSSAQRAVKPSDVPGQRARLFAAGTQTGTVILWDIRAPAPSSASTSHSVEPLRIIYTDSPQISCLALSSLYLVHGGNDGLVQTWDPMASSMQPIRTLHSRFSSRARRRLIQAQASPQGVGINMFAAGSICLDPDPTALRGVVSLGTQLRYWSYSSSAADQYKSNKRRLRRAERGSNTAGDRFSGAARGNLKDYIASEKHELERERIHRQKEAARFAGRFGTELLDGSEEEMMAYAAMLSQETLALERMRRTSDDSAVISTPQSAPASSADYSGKETHHDLSSRSLSPTSLTVSEDDEELDPDLAEAIRQSLELAEPAFNIPIRFAKSKKRTGSSTQSSVVPSPSIAGASRAEELGDLEFALQLSLAEEQSRHNQPVQGNVQGQHSWPTEKYEGKGKGRSEYL